MVTRVGWSRVLTAVLLCLSSVARAQPATDAEPEAEESSVEPPSTAAAKPETASGRDADTSAAKDQARMLFAKGVELFQAGRYKDAIDEFLKAHQVFPNPVLSFNAALAYEKMGDSAGALRFYREYLRQDPEAYDRPQVEQQVSALERKLQDKGIQQVTILSQPDGATVRIDGRPVGVTPWTGELNPGRHRLRLRLEGFRDAEQQFDLLAHRALDVAVALDEQVAAPPPAPAPPIPAPTTATDPSAGPSPSPSSDDHHARVRPLTLITLGAGVATLGAAGVFEGLRQSSEKDVRDETTQIARHDAFDQMESQQTTARILAGVGAAVTVAGGVLLAVDLTRKHPAREARLRCGLDGCLVRGRF